MTATTPEERRQVRRIVLSGLLQTFRAARGWSTNDAAHAAGIAPMTWRRAEDALPVRQRSLTAVDNILKLDLGTVYRALEDDLDMVGLVGRRGVDISKVAPADAAEFLDNLAERVRTGTVTGAGVATSVRGELLVPTTLGLAVMLVERLQALSQTDSIRAAVVAVAAALPDVVAAQSSLATAADSKGAA